MMLTRCTRLLDSTSFRILEDRDDAKERFNSEYLRWAWKSENSASPELNSLDFPQRNWVAPPHKFLKSLFSRGTRFI